MARGANKAAFLSSLKRSARFKNGVAKTKSVPTTRSLAIVPANHSRAAVWPDAVIRPVQQKSCAATRCGWSDAYYQAHRSRGIDPNRWVNDHLSIQNVSSTRTSRLFRPLPKSRFNGFSSCLLGLIAACLLFLECVILCAEAALA